MQFAALRSNNGDKPAKGTISCPSWDMGCTDCLVNSELVIIENTEVLLFTAKQKQKGGDSKDKQREWV